MIHLVYFLKKGIAGLVVKKMPSDLVFIRLQPGVHFGEYDFLQNLGHRMFSAKALSDVELFLLDKKDLYRVDQQFRDVT